MGGLPGEFSSSREDFSGGTEMDLFFVWRYSWVFSPEKRLIGEIHHSIPVKEARLFHLRLPPERPLIE
jgi:hypothetical protein